MLNQKLDSHRYPQAISLSQPSWQPLDPKVLTLSGQKRQNYCNISCKSCYKSARKRSSLIKRELL